MATVAAIDLDQFATGLTPYVHARMLRLPGSSQITDPGPPRRGRLSRFGSIAPVFFSARMTRLMPKTDMICAMLVAVALAVEAISANAQENAGDIAAGRELARHDCSPCHVISPAPHAPRIFEIAPDFQAIANTSGMTETALHAFLLTSHPKMPNLILSPEQSRNVIAYILSLRPPAPNPSRP